MHTCMYELYSLLIKAFLCEKSFVIWKLHCIVLVSNAAIGKNNEIKATIWNHYLFCVPIHSGDSSLK